MTTQSTIDKLIEMRLTSMSDAFLTQLQDARMRDISFEDRFGMLWISNTAIVRATA